MEKRFLKILDELAETNQMDISFSVEHDFYDGRLEPLLIAIKQYTKECVKASLEKCAENAEAGNEEGMVYVKYETIVDNENIILL